MNERNNESRNGGRNENDAVDLVATAQAVQQAGDAWRRPGTVKLVAPAKVNLFLGIGSRREDGYHEAVSILHAIALHDVLYLRRAAGRPSAGEVGAQAAAAAGTSVPRGTAGASAARDAAGTSACLLYTSCPTSWRAREKNLPTSSAAASTPRFPGWQTWCWGQLPPT